MLISLKGVVGWVAGAAGAVAILGYVYFIGASDCFKKANEMATAYGNQIAKERSAASVAIREAQKRAATARKLYEDTRGELLAKDIEFRDWYHRPLPCAAADLSDGVRDRACPDTVMRPGRDSAGGLSAPAGSGNGGRASGAEKRNER